MVPISEAVYISNITIKRSSYTNSHCARAYDERMEFSSSLYL